MLAAPLGGRGGHKAASGNGSGTGYGNGTIVGRVQQQWDLLHASLLELSGVPHTGPEQLIGGEAAQTGSSGGGGNRGDGSNRSGSSTIQQLILIVLGLVQDNILRLGHGNAVTDGRNALRLVVGRRNGAALEEGLDVLQVGESVDLQLVVQLGGNGDGLDILVTGNAVRGGDELDILGDLVGGVDGHQFGFVLVAGLQQDEGDGDDLLELQQDQLLDGHGSGEDAALGPGMGLGDQGALLEVTVLVVTVTGHVAGYKIQERV